MSSPTASSSPPITESQVVRWGKTPDTTSDAVKFLQGPQSRPYEFWKAFKVFCEMIHGFRKLHFVGPCVTVFGSARFDENHVYYRQARLIGQRLAEAGFAVMTGGGPGIMEAANRGAKDVPKARSIGCNIKLPKEQKPNRFVDHFVDFEYFFVRKLMLIKYSYAFIVCPGGFGTLDELFEVLTLIQTGKLQDFPVVMVGREYWEPGIAQMRKFVAEKTIEQSDIDRLFICDDPSEAVGFVTDTAMKKFGLSYAKTLKKRWWLRE